MTRNIWLKKLYKYSRETKAKVHAYRYRQSHSVGYEVTHDSGIVSCNEPMQTYGWFDLWANHVNPLRAKFFRGNIDIYLYFVSFLHIDTMQVVEILPQIRQEPTDST